MVGFVAGGAVVGGAHRTRGMSRTCPVRMAADDEGFKGFGDKPKKPEKKEKSKSQLDREAAEQRLEVMRKAGMPEYSIWLRQKGEEQWFPVGSLAVDRSSKISQAIFENEDALWQGARRQYPKLAGKEAETEIGYKLAAFPDEEVRIAERPSPGGDGIIKSFFDKLLNPLNTEKKLT
eukprot:Plantae.Rhodophyta-Purpureofilum_apyrenoidigerum.ctg13553.p1 GENE.Plantae.Rhodophyta-Purpureofilum_apyrenoidigerum.ctg13553~~Plantae.Rhodophyta-Purpureofilum_apyrenoidigerum.ctg13553.p1  ORF type:complete len:177 (-),score=40.84 Plantae.Rhodophyta-Purpureofilum_apyrenoidigerum.ctg13553:844-1374(-)